MFFKPLALPGVHDFFVYVSVPLDFKPLIQLKR